MNQDDCWKSVLRNITVDLRVGLHVHEQDSRQRVEVSVETRRYVAAHPRGFDVSGIMDYDRVRNYVLAWQHREHVSLLETLALELVDHCFVDPLVDAVCIGIVKPDVFPETEAAGIEVTVTRDLWARK